ncbi:hypothetical protein CEXT_561951 [Caerostris extrusa]|uniref:Uncharacterized protein n=1 Tax=Caerostris extrusa TaxID=172846 RepID=A0AAV4NK81_CAEEX|nr:hypothetical protein CEXT_561951 [Caerostris extrusa]
MFREAFPGLWKNVVSIRGGRAGGVSGNEAPPSEEVLWTAETAAQCICHLECLQLAENSFAGLSLPNYFNSRRNSLLRWLVCQLQHACPLRFYLVSTRVNPSLKAFSYEEELNALRKNSFRRHICKGEKRRSSVKQPLR